MAMPPDVLSALNKEMNTKAKTLYWKDTLTAIQEEEFSTQQLFLGTFLNILYKTLRAADWSRSHLKPFNAGLLNDATEEALGDLISRITDAIASLNWEDVARYPGIQLSPPSVTRSVVVPDFKMEQARATEESWKCEYIGKAADALWNHIKKYYIPSKVGIPHYAPYTSVVQSSGMGKSRLNDELGKRRLTIPINLRPSNASGYPPADHSVREFLTFKLTNQDQAYQRSYCFLAALLKHTHRTLQELFPDHAVDEVEYERFAKEFRDYMTEGMSMKSHNVNRVKFYDKVIEEAQKLLESKESDEIGTAKSASPKHRKQKNLMQENGTRLEDFITDGRSLSSPPPIRKPAKRHRLETTKRANIVPEPLVILSFDEAHTLTEPDEAGQSWTRFTELRRALRMLEDSYIFSLFLSTTGKICQFTSLRSEDYSLRIQEGERILMPPFTDLGFDQFAMPVPDVETDDEKRAWSLDDVTSVEFLCRLGRPLFGSRFLTAEILDDRNDSVFFAGTKLLSFSGKLA